MSRKRGRVPLDVPPCFMFPEELREMAIRALAATGQLTVEAQLCDVARDLDIIAFKRGTPRKPGPEPHAEWRSERDYVDRWGGAAQGVSRRYVQNLLKSPELKAWFKTMSPKKIFPERAIEADDPHPIHKRTKGEPTGDGSKVDIDEKRTTLDPHPDHTRSSAPRKQPAEHQNSAPDPTDPVDPSDPVATGAVDAVDCPGDPCPEQLESGLDDADWRRRQQLLIELKKANESGNSGQRRHLFELLEELGRKGQANKAIQGSDPTARGPPRPEAVEPVVSTPFH